MPVAKSVLIVQLSAAVTAGHRKAESFFTAFQRTPTGKVTCITLFNINLDRVSLAAVACTNNSSRLQTACGSGSTGGSHCHGTGLKKHIVSYQMSPKVSLLGQAGNSLLSIRLSCSMIVIKPADKQAEGVGGVPICV